MTIAGGQQPLDRRRAFGIGCGGGILRPRVDRRERRSVQSRCPYARRAGSWPGTGIR